MPPKRKSTPSRQTPTVAKKTRSSNPNPSYLILTPGNKAAKVEYLTSKPHAVIQDYSVSLSSQDDSLSRSSKSHLTNALDLAKSNSSNPSLSASTQTDLGFLSSEEKSCQTNRVDLADIESDLFEQTKKTFQSDKNISIAQKLFVKEQEFELFSSEYGGDGDKYVIDGQCANDISTLIDLPVKLAAVDQGENGIAPAKIGNELQDKAGGSKKNSDMIEESKQLVHLAKSFYNYSWEISSREELPNSDLTRENNNIASLFEKDLPRNTNNLDRETENEIISAEDSEGRRIIGSRSSEAVLSSGYSGKDTNGMSAKSQM